MFNPIMRVDGNAEDVIRATTAVAESGRLRARSIWYRAYSTPSKLAAPGEALSNESMSAAALSARPASRRSPATYDTVFIVFASAICRLTYRSALSNWSRSS